MKTAKYLWAAFLTLPLISNLFNEELMSETLKVFQSISLGVIAQNLVVIILVIATYVGLTRISTVFELSFWSLFSSKDKSGSAPADSHGSNIGILPAYIKYFGPVFLILMFINLPYFARFEEEIFREGITSWKTGVLVSFAFGLAHCFVGVPIGAGLGISVAGIWFTYQYFVGGVELSTVHHSAYNAILFLAIFAGVVNSHFKKKEVQEEQEKSLDDKEGFTIIAQD